MAGETALSVLDQTGIVAILRGAWRDRIVDTADVLAAAGLRLIEVSLVSPDAWGTLESLASRASPTVVAGAGTVMSRTDVDRAAGIGLRFVVSPHLDPDVVEAAARHGLLCLPGVYSPTEVVRAVQAGAQAVKLFPADDLGPRYVRSLLGPLPGVRLVPTGGVTLELGAQFISAGAWALGVGSPLVGSAPPATDRDWDALSDRARAFLAVARPLSAPE